MYSLSLSRLAQICAYSTEAHDWDQFVCRITPAAVVAARRVSVVWGDTSPSNLSEIVQEVLLKLCEDDRKVLREFEDRGEDSFLKLLRVVSASVATDYFRRIRAEKRGGNNRVISLDALPGSAEVVDRRATRTVEWSTMMSQLDALMLRESLKISARDRAMFWLYYRQGLTAETISLIPAIGLTAKGVESGLARIARVLRQSVLRTGSDEKKSDSIVINLGNGRGFPAMVAIDNMKHE